MNEMQISLTEDEQEFLQKHLTAALKDVMVEEHRTRDISYRELVSGHRVLIERLLEKLGMPAHC